MMKFFTRKILLALFVVAFSFLNAQSNNPGGPCGFGTFPPCSKPASPIDMYVYVLAIIAIIGIAYFAKKYKTQKI